MKKFLTLLEIEFRSLLLIIAGFFGAVTVLSTLSAWSTSRDISNWTHRTIAQRGITVAEYVQHHGGYYGLNQVVGRGMQYAVFIFLFFGIIGAISLYIWNREWSGKSKSIYFLLSLRAPRIRILLTKTVAIIVTSWLYYGLVLVNLAITGVIMRLIFADGLVADNLLRGYLQNLGMPLNLVFPTSILNFVQLTLFTVAIFLTMTVWILLIKSFKWVGGIIGLIYSVGMLALYIYTQAIWLFHDERMIIDWSFVIGSVVLGLVLSWWLLNKKISV